MIRLRGNTKHTQKNGFEPGEITVEVTLDREEDYTPGTITQHTLRVHDELRDACDELNHPTGPTLTNTISTSKEN